MADIVQLTSAETFQADYVPFSTAVSSADGVSITFDFYAYGGQLNGASGTVDTTIGGDGISFFFIDGSQLPSQSGGDGGSLGYAPRGENLGLSGGYLAVGFDEYGNFSTPSEGRVGGVGRATDSVAVRGSQAANYKYLDGTRFGELPISLDNPGPAATQANSKRTAKIDLDQAGNLSVSLDLNLDGTIAASEEIIQLNVIDSQNGALPSTFRFGFAASTGSATNIHEIGNFQVTTFDGRTIPGDFSKNQIIIGNGDDGSGGGDSLAGATGNDLLVSIRPNQRDILFGGLGADRFVFSGANKKQALKTSTLNRPDRVQDFSFSQGDRYQLDYDNNLATITPIEFPKRVFNAGRFTGNLKKAAASAYADKNFKQPDDQALKANEAVFFRIQNKTYLSLNDNKRTFSASNDLFVDVTGMQFKSGDLRKGSLAVPNYFAVDPIV